MPVALELNSSMKKKMPEAMKVALSEAMSKAMSDAVKKAYRKANDSEEVKAYLSERGRAGGLVGGKKSAASLTPEQRTARAKKAAAARIAKRKNAK